MKVACPEISTPAGGTTAALVAASAPEYLTAIIEALRFEDASTARLRRLGNAEWCEALEWCDARQLTLMLPELCGDAIPVAIRQRISRGRDKHAKRFARLKKELFDIADVFNRKSIEFVVLKGLTHSPALTPDPLSRAQGDIDLWVPRDGVSRAQEVLANLGYVAVASAKSRHLAPMMRPSNWKWRGDRFDPAMPISVELHYELWSEQTEYVSAPGQDEFWRRRRCRRFDRHSLDVLCDHDMVAFATLHVLLHLLHGELPMQRAWEIANFLQKHVDDDEFWLLWNHMHLPALRQIEALVFRLVTLWFGCRLNEIAGEEVRRLPNGVQLWVEEFGLSPLLREFHPNKDEIWLHLTLIDSFKNRARVLGRRLFPRNIPGFVEKTEHTRGPMRSFLAQRRSGLIASRLAHHFRALIPTIVAGIRWFWLCQK